MREVFYLRADEPPREFIRTFVLNITCRKCERTLDSSFFSKGKKKCKECTSIYWAEWISKNSDAKHRYDEQYRKSNPEKMRQKYKEYIKKHGREKHLKSYGLSVEKYNEMYKEQNGLCLICEIPSEKLFVDHDHKKGDVRGLLCRNCNSGLGFFLDTPNILVSAIKYLNRR